MVENEITTFNSIPPTGSVFDKLNALRKYGNNHGQQKKKVTVTLIPLIRKQIWFAEQAVQPILQHYPFAPRMSIINIAQEK